MSGSSLVDPFDAAAESFLARLRAGEHPSITEYVLRHPDLADEIRNLFPTLVGMEEIKPVEGSSTSQASPGRGTPAGAELPERLGDYRVLRRIGAGGMGVVYEARRESLQAPVALKVLHPQCRDDREFRRRFRNEARSAARLHHNNIVPVFDFGDHDGVLYCVMQYIPGRPLDRILDDARRARRAPSAEPASTVVGSEPTLGDSPDPAAPDTSRPVRPLDHREVARIGAEVAGALAYAHAWGVLHRDIKPSNLLIDDRGTPWVTDFGLAKYEGGEDLTATGDVVGTVRYMAPERFEGHSDARSDVYALGITLYEMLTLRPAFEGPDRLALIRRIVEESPTPLRRVDPSISRDLETVVHKAIARSPSDRYASAAEVAEELRRVVDRRPIRARRLPPHEQFGRWCRRNPLVAALAASAAALTLLVAVIATASALRLREKNAEVAEQLWESKVAQARAGRLSRTSGQRFDSLAAITEAARFGRELGHPPARFEKLQNEAIAALALPDLQIRQWFGRVVEAEAIDLDDDFQLYVRSGPGGPVVVRRVADDALVAQLSERPGPPRTAFFGPGRWLVEIDGGGALRVRDIDGIEPASPIDEPGGVSWWDVRLDGSLLAVIRRDGSISAYELPGGRKAHALGPGRLAGQTMIRLHPWAPFALVTAYAQSAPIEVRDLRTGASLTIPTPWEGFGAMVPDWTADGRRFAVPNAHGGSIATFAFNPEGPTATLERVLSYPAIDSGLVLRFNPEGDRIIARGWAKYLAMFDAGDGRCLFQAPVNGIWTPRTLRLDRSGRRAFPGRDGDYEPRHGIWSIAEGRESSLLTFPSAPGRTYEIGVSPDGRLAATTTGGRLAFHDVETGRELASLAYKPGPTPRLAFEGDGTLLVGFNDSVARWPVREAPGGSGLIRIGPPQRLDIPSGYLSPASSLDGGVVAVPMADNYGMWPRRGGWVVRRDRPEPAARLLDTPVNYAAVSPDGRWVAFSTIRKQVLVFEVATGAKVWASPVAASSHCRFSPGGEWLATTADGGRMFRVGTWEPGPRLGEGVVGAFLPGGEVAVLVTSSNVIRMVSTANGRELARFEDPDESECQVAVTPDGGKLLATHKQGVRVWDLRRIRAELAGMSLDWEAPPLPVAKGPVGPLRVEIDGADFLTR
jgi:serine/threonine protein kinase